MSMDLEKREFGLADKTRTKHPVLARISTHGMLDAHFGLVVVDPTFASLA